VEVGPEQVKTSRADPDVHSAVARPARAGEINKAAQVLFFAQPRLVAVGGHSRRMAPMLVAAIAYTPSIMRDPGLPGTPFLGDRRGSVSPRVQC